MVRVVDLVEAGPPYRRNARARLVIEGALPGEPAFAFYDRAQERYIGPDSFLGEPHYFVPRTEDGPPGGARRGYTFGPEVTRRLRRDGVFTLATRDGEIGDVACKVATLIEVGAPGTVTIEGGATGVTAPHGTSGPTASRPATGATGAEGRTGATGTSGATGAAGTESRTGATGTGSRTGATGTPGAMGATGPAGATGPLGATGRTGQTGGGGSTGKGGTGATDETSRGAGRDRAKVGRILAVLAALLVVVVGLFLIIPPSPSPLPPSPPTPYPTTRTAATRSEAWNRCETLMAPSWDPASPGGRDTQPRRSEAREAVGVCQTALREASAGERGVAQFRLGRAQQIAGDRETARQTLTEALNRGSKAAAHALGNLYFNDRPPQLVLSAENFRIGANAGIPQSKASLAGLLAEGEGGVAIDIGTAKRLAGEATAAGVGAGARVYGKLVLRGRIPGTRAEACRMFNQAAALGDVSDLLPPLRTEACQ